MKITIECETCKSKYVVQGNGLFIKPNKDFDLFTSDYRDTVIQCENCQQTLKVEGGV